MWQRIKDIVRGIGIVLLSPFIAVGLLVLLGLGAPVVFLMFVALYAVIGPLLQILVRVVPQPAKENQPTPWPQYWSMAFTYVLRAGAVLALVRALLFGLPMLFADNAAPPAASQDFIFLPLWDWFFGCCGLLYAFLSFSQEGSWLRLQTIAVRNLPTSNVASAAIGLSEFSGVVRRIENREGPIDPERGILGFYWKLLGTQIGPRGETMLGTYDRDMKPFYLDDGTGKILVDPVHSDVELRRPFISAFTTFFGRRSFEILLRKRTQKPSWHERRYVLQEGDQVYVIGYVEANPAAPPDAAGPDRLAVRPRPEARAGYEALLQFLVPGRTPARTPQDIFIIADTSEAEAKRLLKKNFLASAATAVLLAVLSAALIVARM